MKGTPPSARLDDELVGPTLRELTGAIAFDANRTVGGGLVSIELLRRRFTGRGWIDASVHALFIAVSRFTPGTVVLAYCVSLGYRFHGWPGALLALTVASVPASLIVFALSVTLAQIDRYAAVRVVLAVGILIAGVLVLSSAWYLVRPYLEKQSRIRLAVIVAVSISLVVAGATPVRVLMIAAAVSCLLPVSDTTR